MICEYIYNVWRYLDTEPGCLVDHGVGVDLAHVVPAVLQHNSSDNRRVLDHLRCSLSQISLDVEVEC